MAEGYLKNVAVVGATGAVGEEMLNILAERSFPVGSVRPLASSRSAGRRVDASGRKIDVEVLGPDSFEGIDLALFSAGEAVSRRFAPIAVAAGAIVVDNSSAFRMEPDVPLVVPEVNPSAAAGHRGIIANPNCATIQMVVALAPIHRAAGIKRIVVATYQSVSGAGRQAMAELDVQMAAIAGGIEPVARRFPHPIAGNLFPDWGRFNEEGQTVEESKMARETAKILDAPSIKVFATTVRVPVRRGHAEAVAVETERPISPDEARRLLAAAPGVVVQEGNGYVTPRQAAGTDPVYVGRIRRDPTVPNGLALWVVSDNLRKGAALNAVQIAEMLFGKGSLAAASARDARQSKKLSRRLAKK